MKISSLFLLEVKKQTIINCVMLEMQQSCNILTFISTFECRMFLKKSVKGQQLQQQQQKHCVEILEHNPHSK